MMRTSSKVLQIVALCGSLGIAACSRTSAPQPSAGSAAAAGHESGATAGQVADQSAPPTAEVAAEIAEAEAADVDEEPAGRREFDWYTPSFAHDPNRRSARTGGTIGSYLDVKGESTEQDNGALPVVPLDPSTVEISGAESFDPKDVREALDTDFELIVAAHLDARYRMEGLTQTLIVRALESGYLRAGFADVAVDVHSDHSSGRIELQITEGARYRCAGAEVTGTRNVPREALVAGLTERPWWSYDLWTAGGPAPFDDRAAADLRQQVKTVFADHGYPYPEFRLEIDKNAADRSAMLVVNVENEGPRAVIGKIDVTGTKRDSVDDVLKYLDVQPGMLYEATLPDRLKRRLWDSGRYVTYNVEAKPREDDLEREEAGHANDPSTPFDLRIELSEYGDAPPLGQELSAAQQAVLKLDDWLKRWGRGEESDEIVLTATVGPTSTRGLLQDLVVGERVEWYFISKEWFKAWEREAPDASRLSLRAVLAPKRGQVLSAQLTGADGQRAADIVLIAQSGRAVLASPRRKMKLELPNSGEWRADLELEPRLDGRENNQTWDDLALHFSLALKRRDEGDPYVASIHALLAPGAALALAHTAPAGCTFEDGVWTFRNGNYVLRFEGENGRLIEFTSDTAADGTCLNCRTVGGALASELELLSGPSGPLSAAAAQPAESPCKALLRFALDEFLDAGDALGDRSGSLAALHKLLDRWSPTELGDMVGSASVESFYIPDRWPFVYKNAFLWHERNFVPVLARVLPRQSWLWHRVVNGGRDAFGSMTVGPIGKLLATAENWWRVARHDAEPLAGLRFATDYEPFLKNDSWLGACFLALIDAARSLDESELRDLAALFPETAREPVARSLLLLKRDPEKPAAEVATAALDLLWSDLLQAPVEQALTYVIKTFEALEAEYPVKDDQVQPVSAESTDEEPGMEQHPEE